MILTVTVFQFQSLNYILIGNQDHSKLKTLNKTTYSRIFLRTYPNYFP